MSAEEREQARLVRWSHKPAVRALMPELRFLHHSPNGGQRTRLAGAQMKAMGTKAGFPDLVLITARPLTIEMKFGDGRTSKEQVEWLGQMSDAGWSVHVCYSAEEARLVLLKHFGIAAVAAPGLDA